MIGQTEPTSPAPGRELGHAPILHRALSSILPSPENEKLYRPVDPNASDIIALADDIARNGVQEPLVITADGWIVSGHRRYVAARLAGLEAVPCIVKDFNKDDDHDQFMRLLRGCNRQRVKSFDEVVREEVLDMDPQEAYAALLDHRQQQSEVVVEAMDLGARKGRARITPAKEPMLTAIDAVLDALRDFWPLSDRQIHYALLNNPPLIHASKPKSRYRNDGKSYRALVELLTRARLCGHIPMRAIQDVTRPVTLWNVHADPASFIRRECEEFCRGYWRDLQRTQPNHIEIVVEKNTVEPILKPVAGEYTIPMTSGRGQCSIPPRAEMAERFLASGKDKLILLLVTDHDPDGEVIASSFARSMRDDFGIEDVHAIKVALTDDQVRDFALPPGGKAKPGSSNYRRFVEQHGKDVYELEALPPKTLRAILREAIEPVIDRDALNAELKAEKRDALELEHLRRRVQHALDGIGGGL